ncbi:MAG: prepilin-type N-terminal cleavage/methylation domain-containing protein [Eubacteriales bacterium]
MILRREKISAKGGESMFAFRRVLKNRKGFTLVELMVVVVIIGILVAIAIPVYNGTQNTARISAVQANVRIINGSIAAYQANNGAYPASATYDDLIILLTGNTNGGPYLKAAPVWPDGTSAQTYTAATGSLTATFGGTVYQ